MDEHELTDDQRQALEVLANPLSSSTLSQGEREAIAVALREIQRWRDGDAGRPGPATLAVFDAVTDAMSAADPGDEVVAVAIPADLWLDFIEENDVDIADADGADVLRLLMEANGLSPLMIAAAVGMKPEDVRAVLDGERLLEESERRELGKHFNVSPDLFASDDLEAVGDGTMEVVGQRYESVLEMVEELSGPESAARFALHRAGERLKEAAIVYVDTRREFFRQLPEADAMGAAARTWDDLAVARDLYVLAAADPPPGDDDDGSDA